MDCLSSLLICGLQGTPFVSTMLMPDLSMCSQEELESAILRGMRMTSQELKLHCTFEMDSAEVWIVCSLTRLMSLGTGDQQLSRFLHSVLCLW